MSSAGGDLTGGSSADLSAEVAAEQAVPLPADGLAAVVAELWPGGSLVSVERILGGLGAAMHRLDAVDADGRPDAVIVRRYLAAYGDGPEVAEREHATLSALSRAGAPAPAARWLDAEGRVLGRPALAMSVVPGRPLVTAPVPDVGALAGVLADAHRLPVGLFGHLPPAPGLDRQVERSGAHAGRVTAGFVDVRQLWAGIDRWVATGRAAPPTLVHGDFHPGNVLSDGATTTVVDWTWARLGDPAWDLACCRYDLELAYGPEVVSAFTTAYLDAGGPARPSAGWDLVAVASSLPSPAGWLRAFTEHGRTDCTAAGFEAAGRSFVADALARMAGRPR